MRPVSPVAAVLLAAGSSRRFEGSNKLLADWQGKPLIRHIAETLLRAGVARVVVVTGHDAEAIRAALEGLPTSFVHNARHAEGMGTTIAAGVAALSQEEAALIVPGDMPWIREVTMRQILQAGSSGAIVVPCHRNRLGNPVLFPPELRAKLVHLSGDRGARLTVEANAERVIRLEVLEQELQDIDYRVDLESSNP